MKYFVTPKGKMYHIYPSGITSLCGLQLIKDNGLGIDDKIYKRKPRGFRECKNCTKALNSRFLTDL